MLKISTVVQQEVEASPFYSEGLKEGLINVSALARKIQARVEKRLGKPVRESTIVMAINRLPLGELVFVERQLRQFFKKVSDISVRSNLVDYTFRNSNAMLDGLPKLLAVIQNKYPTTFYSFSQGLTETTIVSTNAIQKEIDYLFHQEALLDKKENLSGITLLLPKENRSIFGVYYFILKELAWKGINLIELISTSNEFTVIIHDSDLKKTFEVLNDMTKGTI